MLITIVLTPNFGVKMQTSNQQFCKTLLAYKMPKMVFILQILAFKMPKKKHLTRLSYGVWNAEIGV